MLLTPRGEWPSIVLYLQWCIMEEWNTFADILDSIVMNKQQQAADRKELDHNCDMTIRLHWFVSD